MEKLKHLPNSVQEPIPDPPECLPQSLSPPPNHQRLARRAQFQEEIWKPQCGPENFDQEQVETLWEKNVDADSDAEGEEEECKDVWGGIHAAGASPSPGEQDVTEGYGRYLPSSVTGVDNYPMDKLHLQKEMWNINCVSFTT